MKRDVSQVSADPRAILVVSMAFAVVVGISTFGSVLALVYSLSLLARRSIHHPRWWREVLWLNVFLVVLAISSLMVPGAVELPRISNATSSIDRAWNALFLLCRGNAIFLFITTTARPLGSIGLARGLEGLGLPMRLVKLFTLVARYATLLGTQWVTVRRAVMARGFQWQVDRRSVATVATATAMVLIRSVDRSERIERALRARQFSPVLARSAQPEWSSRSTLFVAFHFLFLASLLALDAWFS